MILWISLVIAVIGGLLQPFCGRLQGTGLWVGKALVPAEAASSYPQGIQDALTDGWPSTVTLIVGLIPFAALVIGFFHTWWAGILAFLISLFISEFAKRTTIASKTVDRYIVILMDHANRRGADYSEKGDMQRAEAANEIGQQLEELLSLYMNSGVPAPTVKEARVAPYGEPDYLLEVFHQSTK